MLQPHELRYLTVLAFYLLHGQDAADKYHEEAAIPHELHAAITEVHENMQKRGCTQIDCSSIAHTLLPLGPEGLQQLNYKHQRLVAQNQSESTIHLHEITQCALALYDINKELFNQFCKGVQDIANHPGIPALATEAALKIPYITKILDPNSKKEMRQLKKTVQRNKATSKPHSNSSTSCATSLRRLCSLLFLSRNRPSPEQHSRVHTGDEFEMNPIHDPSKF
jgi:hypothetical protein